MGQLDFSGLEVQQLSPDAALILGHWHLKRASGDVGGVFTLIFRRFPVGWRIIHDHTSAEK
jgi:ketosteroid isomerase-like protein